MSLKQYHLTHSQSPTHIQLQRAGISDKRSATSSHSSFVAPVSRDAASSHHISVKDLIDAKLIFPGDEIYFKEQNATINAAGNIHYRGIEFTSLSKWAKHIASAMGLTKHYNGWNVALLKSSLRPMGQYRDKFYADHAGLPYTFPPLDTKKRKRMNNIENPARKSRSLKNESPIRMPHEVEEDTESDTTSHAGGSSTPDDDPKQTSFFASNLLSGGFNQSESTQLSDLDEYPWHPTCIEDLAMVHEGPELQGDAHCGQPRCYVCEILDPNFASHFPTWADILQLSLYSLGQIRNNEKQYFSLGEEIYPFVDRHWHKLCGKPRNSSWRQTAKMTLAHLRYADLFENGYDSLNKTGFWRLKNSSRELMDALSGQVCGSIRVPSIVDHSSSFTSNSNINSYGTSSSPTGVNNKHQNAQSNDAALLSSLATDDEVNALSSLASIGRRRKVPDSSRDEDFIDGKKGYTAERKHKMAQLHRSQSHQDSPPTPSSNRSQTSPVDAIAKLRAELQHLENKYKALEVEHRAALSQLDKYQTLFLATRQYGESTRLSYAHQSELQEGQVRLLLEKIHRLEMELQQASSAVPAVTSINNPNTSSSLSINSISSNNVPSKNNTVPSGSNSNALDILPSSQVNSSTASTLTSNVPTPTTLTSMAPTLGSSLMGIPGLSAANLGLTATAGSYPLLTSVPWLGAFNQWTWGLQDPTALQALASSSLKVPSFATGTHIHQTPLKFETPSPISVPTMASNPLTTSVSSTAPSISSTSTTGQSTVTDPSQSRMEGLLHKEVV